ncbi:hypothetical protein HUG17_6343 [Dermatophagoides farinae]|uniref:Uncharacterized protein n=1 Tax=Dermatophagoides farinae TaxID=6954 RepID=A0A9D4P4C6_DERFA|nr:hypothetical protein HUG17_6343 [Dermatophagoides farinae]
MISVQRFTWSMTKMSTVLLRAGQLFRLETSIQMKQLVICSTNSFLTTHPTTLDDVPFSSEEAYDAILTENDNKSRGEDGICANIIKHLNNLFPTLFLNIYNACLKLGTFPDRWKVSIVKVIPKPGSSDLQTASIPKNLVNIFRSQFTNRKAKLTICGESAEKLLSRGCPQGAKCSPLLWNILYDNLLKLHLPTGEADFQIIF